MGTAASMHEKEEEEEEEQAARAQQAAQSPPAQPPPAQPFDWYADPLFYDIIFQEDTPVETSMLRQIARHYATEGSPMRRIRPEPEPESETAAESEPESGSEQQPGAAKAAPNERGSSAVTDESQSTPAAATAAGPSSSSPALIRVLEPACGSGRLMLSLLEAGARSDPRDLRWSVTGFDVSEGAVRFARDRWKKLEAQMQVEQQKADKDAEAPRAAAGASDGAVTAAAASSTPVAPASAVAVPPFTAFVADMRNFAEELSSALEPSQSQSPQSRPSPPASSPAPLPQFDLAHCLVSSLKHLLEPADVLAHFESVHATLVPGGLYIVALHIHTLYGRSHFDRDVRYDSATASNTAAAASAAQTRPAGADADADAAATAAATVAPSAAPTNAVSPDNGVGSSSESESDDEIDDAFERAYERDGTRFKAELITYAPDAHTMLEKMIARVQLHDSRNSPVAASPSPSPSPGASSSPPLQSDMSLRVYTLSTLHTLLCALAPLFALAAAYNYADIYDSEWRASDPRAALPYPYPAPSLAQLASTAGTGGARDPGPAPSRPFVPRHPQRNWNRVYPVSKRVKQMWDGVEAIVLVLRKQEITSTPTPTQAE